MRSRRGFRVKGVKRYTVNGTPYRYHRASGIALPTDVPENDPVFIAAYAEAERAAQAPRKQKAGVGTIDHTWHLYLHSDAHRALSASYRQLLMRDGAKLCEKAGRVLLRKITAKHIRNDMSALSPHAGNKRRKTWRALCKFACDEGFISVDPSDGIKSRPTPKSRPHAPWQMADIRQFRAKWPVGSRERLAFELIHWTGARMSDAVRLGEPLVDGEGWLTFSQQKTGGEVSIPFRRTAPEFADGSDLDKLHACIASAARHLTWIVTAYGSSRSQKAASQWFASAARAAGLDQKTAHGLRKTRAIKLAENGATHHQIGAWTGHESLEEIEHYTRAAAKKRLLMGAEEEQKLSKARGR